MATCVVGIDRADVLQRVQRVMRVFGSGDDDPEQVLEERSERWIAGTPGEVVARLEALAEAGVERVYLQHLVHDDVEMVELVGAEVLPALSS
jgi:alkanesulfonate monooxygenase SsuD/methylene tetrahydromethanopterin reductase-like flavin-dependent oxidoreductase (luciferase family)